MTRFDVVGFDEADYPDFEFASVVKKVEAEELLNVGAPHLPAVIEAKLLTFDRVGNGMEASKAATLAVARIMVAPAELGAITETSSRRASTMARRLGIRRIACGWARQDLVSKGVIPANPLLSGAAAAGIVPAVRSKRSGDIRTKGRVGHRGSDERPVMKKPATGAKSRSAIHKG